MGTDLGDLAIVRAIIELGHSLGLRVVAEGVEDELARDLLAGNDCDVIQGYLVSRAAGPGPAGRLAVGPDRDPAAGSRGVKGAPAAAAHRLSGRYPFPVARRRPCNLFSARPLSSVGRASPW